jgi:hypothetical protein
MRRRATATTFSVIIKAVSPTQTSRDFETALLH